MKYKVIAYKRAKKAGRLGERVEIIETDYPLVAEARARFAAKCRMFTGVLILKEHPQEVNKGKHFLDQIIK